MDSLKSSSGLSAPESPQDAVRAASTAKPAVHRSASARGSSKLPRSVARSNSSVTISGSNIDCQASIHEQGVLSGDQIHASVPGRIYGSWLEKRSGSKFSTKRWKKRYFVLTNDQQLLYYADERCRSPAVGSVDLKGSKVIRPAKYLTKRAQRGTGPQRGNSVASFGTSPPPSPTPPASRRRLKLRGRSGGSGSGLGVSLRRGSASYSAESTASSTTTLSSVSSVSTSSSPTSQAAAELSNTAVSASSRVLTRSGSGIGGGKVLEIVNPRRSWTLRSNDQEAVEKWFSLLHEILHSVKPNGDTESSRSQPAIPSPSRSRSSSNVSSKHNTKAAPSHTQALSRAASSSAGASGPDGPCSPASAARTLAVSATLSKSSATPGLPASSVSTSSASAHSSVSKSSRTSHHSLFPTGTSSSSSSHRTALSLPTGRGDEETSTSSHVSDDTARGSRAKTVDVAGGAASAHAAGPISANALFKSSTRHKSVTPAATAVLPALVSAPPLPPVSSEAQTKDPSIGLSGASASTRVPAQSRHRLLLLEEQRGGGSLPPPVQSEDASRRARAGRAKTMGVTSGSEVDVDSSPEFAESDDDEEELKFEKPPHVVPSFDPQRIDSLWAPIVDKMLQQEADAFWNLMETWGACDRSKLETATREEVEREIHEEDAARAAS